MRTAFFLCLAVSAASCPKAAVPAPGPDAATMAGSALETCVDAWLHLRNLNEYGDPEGTMYAGGTPLFDERTGRSTDRLAHVFARQPAARRTCEPAR